MNILFKPRAWLACLISLFLLVESEGQQLVNLEYFFDTDPGWGNGQSVTIPNQSNIQDFSFPIDISGLSQGFHWLSVRSQDANGKWSVTSSRAFFINGLPTVSYPFYNLVEAEYFFDTDPGAGNGTSVALADSAEINHKAIPVDLSGLDDGYHTFGIRTKDAGGKWSLASWHFFIKGSLPGRDTATANLAGAEYFLDVDPGFGNGTPIVLPAGNDVTNFLFDVDLSGLSDGIHTLSVRTKDDQGQWSLVQEYVFLRGSLPNMSNSQVNLDSLEYFFDTDPGLGNGTAVNLPASTVADSAAFAVDITSLSYGVHEFFARVKDVNGKWSLTNRMFIYKVDPATLPTVNITGLEYFFNTDPGFGNGTQVSLPNGINIENHAFTIDVTALADQEMHTLYIRTRDADGQWSLTQKKAFFKYQPIPDPPTPDIVAIEYFLDADPGLGNGTPITISPIQDTSGLVFSVNIDTLSIGFHQLSIRSKNGDGDWSLTHVINFFKNELPGASNSVDNLVALEYYFNADPGYGNGTPVTLAPSLDTSNFTFPVDLSALGAGIHVFHLRSKNAAGEWSMDHAYVVYRGTLPGAVNDTLTDLVNMEYFIDEDPGFGNGVQVPFTQGTEMMDFTFEIDIFGWEPGIYTVNVRTQDGNGKWGKPSSRIFVIGSLPVPFPSVATDLVEVEFFYNEDPGFGNGISVPLSAETDINNFFFEITGDSLAPGDNTIYFRTKDSQGKWSLAIGNEYFNTYNDIAVTDVISPEGGCEFVGNQPVTVVIENLGGIEQNAFDVAYSYDGGPVVTESVSTDSLANIGDTIHYTFSTPVSFSATGEFTFKAYTILPTDIYPENDTLNTMVENSPQVDAPGNLIPLNGMMGLTPPITLFWTPPTYATQYDVYIWPDTAAQPATPVVADHPFISYNYQTQFISGAMYKWQVVAKNTHCEMASAIQEFSLKELPDLEATDIQVPISPFSGTQINISYTVENKGMGETGMTTWYDVLYLSKDTVFSFSDTYLGAYPNLTALQPGQGYTRTVAVNLANGLIGDYYVFVRADHHNYLYEANDSNNEFRKMMNVNLTPPPDLRITDIIAPNNAFSDTKITFQYEVTNNGTGDGGSSASRDYFYLSPTPVFSPANAVYIGQSAQGTSLDANESIMKTAEVELPDDMIGTNYIYVVVDANDKVYEYVFDNNNTSAGKSINIILKPPPDLQPVAANYNETASPNENVNVSYDIGNYGVVDIFPDGFPIEWGPSDWSTPGYNCHPNNYSYPLSYVNYVLSPYPLKWKDAIYICPCETFDPDSAIRVATVQKTLTIDRSITKTSTCLYQPPGGGSSTTVNGVTVFYPPPPPVSIPRIDSIKVTDVDTLATGNSYVRSSNVKIPANLQPGKYYFYIEADHENNVNEFPLENNNVFRGDSIVILETDLTVDSIYNVDTINSGENLSVRYWVKNNGPGKLIGKGFYDSLFIVSTPVLNYDSIVLATRYYSTATLDTTETQSRIRSFAFPNGISGKYYIFVKTDALNQLSEADEANNWLMDSVQVNLSPWPDLQVTTLTGLPDSAFAGDLLTIDFTIQNLGTAEVPSGTRYDRVYISPDTTWIPANAKLLKAFTRQQPLQPGVSYSRNYTFTLPMLGVGQNSGICYIYVHTDDPDRIYEYTDEGNNYIRSNPIAVTTPDPVDFEVTQITTLPDTIFSGQDINVAWTVRNNGSTTELWNYGLWYDGVYISDHPVWDGDCPLVKDFTQTGPVANNATYDDDQTFKMLTGVSGDYYFYLVADHVDYTNDTSMTGNIAYIYPASNPNGTGPVKTIHVKLADPPDLIVDSLYAPAIGTSGQQIKVVWRVTNTGPGPTVGNWTDKVYLSTDQMLSTNDPVYGTKSQNRVLQPGEFYLDSLTVNLPTSLLGNFILFVKTDANSTVFEHLNEDNNSLSSVLTVFQPLPSDLVVLDIRSDSMASVGQPFTIDYDLGNQSLNAAAGNMKDLLYLSADSIYDVSDVKFGGLQGRNVSIFTTDTASFSVTATTPGVPTGEYFIVACTDVKDNIFEIDNENNHRISTYKVQVGIDSLPIGVLTATTLIQKRDRYYRIVVPDSLVGETMLLTLTGAPGSVNELYLSHGSTPTRASHDYAYENANSPDQSIIVPELLAGTYYLLAYSSSGASPQNADLLAEIINFEILDVNAKLGGNTGNVTLEIDGSKFTPNMELRLEKTGLGSHTADQIYYINTTKVYATFNLAGATIGMYDLTGDKDTLGTTTLVDAFEIIAGDPGTGISSGNNNSGGSFTCSVVNIGNDNYLGKDLQYPEQVRINRIVPITIQFGNGGTVDIPAPTRLFISLRGAPLSFSAQEVEDSENQELLLEFEEPGGPPNILRPGAFHAITVYAFSSHPLRFVLTE